MRYAAPGDETIFIHCQNGWSWINNDPLIGIQGNWYDGTPFSIKFINDTTYGYDPVWMSIKVPEPATLSLLALGGLLMRRKK
jgi:hypothetical protein